MRRMGFTMVELLLVMGIFAILIALSSVNYFSTINQNTVGNTENVLIADLRSAQNKAMSGTSVSGVSQPSWGVKFLGNSYVIFPGTTYSAGNTNNYVVTLPDRVVLSTTFPSSQVQFSRISGEIMSYSSATDTITLTVGSSSKTIELNVYGTITGS